MVNSWNEIRLGTIPAILIAVTWPVTRIINDGGLGRLVVAIVMLALAGIIPIIHHLLTREKGDLVGFMPVFGGILLLGILCFLLDFLAKAGVGAFFSFVLVPFGAGMMVLGYMGAWGITALRKLSSL